MRHIDSAERRARLGKRHFLAEPGPTVEAIAGGVAGLHSSDPATVYLSAWSRLGRFEVADMEEALYVRRTLVRMLGMRRTMFVVPLDFAGVMDAACTRGLAPGERKRLIRMIEDQGIAGDGAAWLERVSAATLEALHDLGQATAAELTAVVPDLKEKLVFGRGKKWGGSVGISTRVLFLLATDAEIIRARPRGSWISSQYRWAPLSEWVEGGLPGANPAEARRDLARRWLRTFGPGTLTDVKWWTKWNLGETRDVLGEVGAVEVELDHGTGYVLGDDLEPTPDPGPWVALLPGLDPTVMGWKERDWYLCGHGAELFDRNGNAGPTVWHNGRVVGGWTQRADGRVVYALLEPVSSEAEGMIEAKAQQLTEWLGDTRLTPRFRTPLDKRLAG